MSLPPSSTISTSISSNGSAGTRVRAYSVSSCSNSPPTSSAVRPSTRTTSPAVDSIEPMPPSRRPVGLDRGAGVEQAIAHLDRPARMDEEGAGLLAEADHRHLHAARLDRTLEARVGLDPVDRKEAIGGGSVGVEVHRRAGRGVGDHDGVHRRPDLAAEGLLGHAQATRACGSARVRWRRRAIPSPARRTAPHRAREARRACPATSRPGPSTPATQPPTATVMPGVTASRNVFSAASYAPRSMSATAGGEGTSSGYSCSSGTTSCGSNGSSTPTESCSHDISSA